jgi:arsenite methyltransferase
MNEIKIVAKPAGRVQVFDPPMCCSTGVCGPAVNPVLPRFAADLAWLKGQGVTVSRFNLSQQPGAFVANEVVKAEIAGEGADCLPMVLVDGRIVSRRTYPTRNQLAEWVGLASSSTSL